ncbi:MAG: hypothetical protein ACRELD_12690 [Longimicrobiales bacterium]
MFRIKRLSLLVAPLALFAIAGCGDDPVAEEDEEVFEMVLTVGTQVVTIIGGTVAGTFDLGVNSTSTLTTAFFAADGDAMVLDVDEFELRITSSNAAVVDFTSTGPFTGTLEAGSAGQTTIHVELFHLVEGHSDIDAIVTVRVQ